MSILLTTIVLFAVTNIDDIILLMTWYSQRDSKLNSYHIIIGQYLGFVSLLIISIIGSLGAFFIPEEWIGFLGLVPIYLGGKAILERYRERKREQQPEREGTIDSTEETPKPNTTSNWIVHLLHPSIYKVATVTFANGGDNIGIYTPFLATYQSGHQLSIIVILFLLLVAVWCYIAFKLVSFPLVAHTVEKYGRVIVPPILIGLGILILVENGTIAYII